MCSLAVSGDGEEAASHRDEALKLQSDEERFRAEREETRSVCVREKQVHPDLLMSLEAMCRLMRLQILSDCCRTLL